MSKPEHGTRACYTGGCRRPECRAANTQYERNRRAGTVECFYGLGGADVSDIIDDLALLLGSR